jgi:hypothetical protein
MTLLTTLKAGDMVQIALSPALISRVHKRHAVGITDIHRSSLGLASL